MIFSFNFISSTRFSPNSLSFFAGSQIYLVFLQAAAHMFLVHLRSKKVKNISSQLQIWVSLFFDIISNSKTAITDLCQSLLINHSQPYHQLIIFYFLRRKPSRPNQLIKLELISIDKLKRGKGSNLWVMYSYYSIGLEFV